MEQLGIGVVVSVAIGAIVLLVRGWQAVMKPSNQKVLPPAPIDRSEKVRRVLKHVTRKKDQ